MRKNVAGYLLALVLMVCGDAAFAQAGPPTQISTTLTNISTWLTSIGVVIITIAVMWAGYKMAFAGARFMDISNIFIGAAIAGAAGVIAGWFFG